ncbi:MAG: hypothetical protein QG609_219 [Patescibacteria group bacterium]|nr:hypothetical protein [Patescibacteria group bacterium]
MKKSLLYVGALVAVFAPGLVSAQNGIDDAIDAVQGWISALIPLIIGIGVLVFLWGVVQYITAGSDSDKRKEGGYLMAYGIVGLFVMISIWGLVNFVSDTTGITPGTTPDAPEIPEN